MNKRFSKILLVAAVLSTGGAAAVAHAAGVWKADLEVAIGAVKGNQLITYTITVKNLADDTARDTVVSHTPSYSSVLNGMSIASVSASSTSQGTNGSPTTCVSSLVNNTVLSVKCTVPVLHVGATETIVVVVNNPGNYARTGTAQAMGISPDPNPANNFDSVAVP